jgi:hypothetical protein
LCSNFLYWIKGAQARLAVDARAGGRLTPVPPGVAADESADTGKVSAGRFGSDRGLWEFRPKIDLPRAFSSAVDSGAVRFQADTDVVGRRRGRGPWRAAASPQEVSGLLAADSVVGFGKVATPFQ